MTTAHRPTFNPRLGGFTLRDTNPTQLGQVSSRDQAGQGVLKERHDLGPTNDEPNTRSQRLRAQLERREQQHFLGAQQRKRADATDAAADAAREAKRRRLLAEAGVDADADADVDAEATAAAVSRWDAGSGGSPRDSDGGSDADVDYDEDDDEDDDDDEEALLRELEKIRSERAAERERQAQEQRDAEALARESRALESNPLLGGASVEFRVKRAWDDDVVFRNQARGSSAKTGPRFINDMLRSDFHRKFMQKYIK